MDGKTARGASSPANPALTRPEPLSHTRAVVSSSSHMFGLFWDGLLYETEDGNRQNISFLIFTEMFYLLQQLFDSIYIKTLNIICFIQGS